MRTASKKLEEIALPALQMGCLLMEAGSSARPVEEHAAMVARGLGAERVDLRIGYASIAITVEVGEDTITRMQKVGGLGVNQRLDHDLRVLATRVRDGQLDARELQAEMDRLVRETPRHPAWLVAVAVGLACAAFGRLLNVDWAGVFPIFAAASVAQYMRRVFASHHVNVFIAAAAVSFLGSALAGLGAKWAGSKTVEIAMIAAVLLLVPGVPALNAQNDILEGRPTLGSARAVWVVMLLIFLTVGLRLSKALMGGV